MSAIACGEGSLIAIIVLKRAHKKIMNNIAILMSLSLLLLPLSCQGRYGDDDDDYDHRDDDEEADYGYVDSGELSKGSNEEICVSHRCLPKDYKRLELPSQHNKVNMTLEVRRDTFFRGRCYLWFSFIDFRCFED